jgi:hypothetical protein
MKNPFYALLVVVGVLFSLTACAYFVMALRGANPELVRDSRGWLAALEEHGLRVLLVELAVLAVATFGAIGTDDYWTRRAKREFQERTDESESLRKR